MVRVGFVAIEQRQVLLRNVRLGGEGRRGIQDPLASERGAERTDAKVPPQVGSMRRPDVEDALCRVGVADGDRPRIDGEPLRVIPRRAVQALRRTSPRSAGSG